MSKANLGGMASFHRAIFLIGFWIISGTTARAQIISQLLSGPIPMHTTSEEINLWFLLLDTKVATVTLRAGAEIFSQTLETRNLPNFLRQTPAKFRFSGLSPDTEYEVDIQLDREEIKKQFKVRTFPSLSVKDFSFQIGSCNFTPPKTLYWLYPGKEGLIHKVMKDMAGDFMLWLGDYLYYLPKHYRSARGMMIRQIRQRKVKTIEAKMRARPQYIVWDDHEYGPNDSGREYALRDTALGTHKLFWQNPYFGTDSAPGNYSHFRLYDAEFFLMDNRYYRSKPDEENPAFWGDRQLNWLIELLSQSSATFKFVATGSQFLNEVASMESFAQYPEERNRLFQAIREKNISGVVLLSGDVHYTELLRNDTVANYPLYEYTCSPMTSIVYNVARSKEGINPMRVSNTLVTQYNFGRVEISGQPGDRTCKLLNYTDSGNLIWEYSIHEKELQPQP